MPDTPFSLKLYRWLLDSTRPGFLRTMPRRWRGNFATNSLNRAGPALLQRFGFADLAISIPAQVSREVSQDVRHTLRLWASRPWHTGFAIAALAIGIGANTGVFSVVNALLLRSLPFHEPSRLAALHHGELIPPHDSARQFHEWRQQSTYLADAALVEKYDVNLGGVSDPGRAHVAQ